MIRQMASVAVLAGSAMLVGVVLVGQPASAQDQGARAGGSYLPSTHSKGCGGIMCDGDDPRRAPGAPPPPPCEGLLCSVSPFGMGRPVTAAEAQRIQEQQARPAVAPAAEPVKPKRSARRKKAKAAKSVAARTPDPTPTAPEASR